MNENWYAFYLSIISETPPDEALTIILGTRTYTRKKEKKKISKKEIKEFTYIDDPIRLVELKKTHTYDEMAKIYGVNRNKVFINIKHYKEQVLEIN